MLAEYSEYMPLGLLILVSAFLGYLIWRGNYKIGAYIVQVGAALFLSSVAGFHVLRHEHGDGDDVAFHWKQHFFDGQRRSDAGDWRNGWLRDRQAVRHRG